MRASLPTGSRSGFALLFGKPNVGKSTLLNHLVGEHLAAVSPRPQTTRQRLLGIVRQPGTELLLVDAPGVHQPRGLLHRAMVEAATSALAEVDVVLYLAEAGWPAGAQPGSGVDIDVVGQAHRDLLRAVKKAGKPVVLVLTKIDLVERPKLLPIIDAWRQAFDFADIYPLSALTGENASGLVGVVRQYLPEGPPLYPEEQMTDASERALAAEFIREQLFLKTQEEVPYGTAVAIDAFDEQERESDRGPGLVRIEATIIVERASHKGIVLGKGGERLKEIGTEARKRLEKLLGCRVWLGLHVRVVPGWTEKRALLSELGLT